MADTMVQARWNGHSMVGKLERVLVCSPRTAGWDRMERVARWQELGFLHAPSFATAQAQHEALCAELARAGAEIVELPPAEELTLDAAYTHEMTFWGCFGPAGQAEQSLAQKRERHD